jgi:hypothetical protein
MKNQLQYTTLFVVVMVLLLGSGLYFLDSPGSNQLTSAAVAVSIDCSLPLPESATAAEREMYNKECNFKE